VTKKSGTAETEAQANQQTNEAATKASRQHQSTVRPRKNRARKPSRSRRRQRRRN